MATTRQCKQGSGGPCKEIKREKEAAKKAEEARQVEAATPMEAATTT